MATTKKSAEAFRTISEVADELCVPQHVLRFWETRFSQVRPMKRGGGRRYYRRSDIDLLLGIKQLLYHQGYTIKGVQKLIKENGSAFIAAIGSGNLEAAADMARKKQAEQNNDLFPEDVLPDKAPGKINGRKFFGLLRGEDDKTIGMKKPRLSKDSSTLLQEALFELIECKRLLDRSRSG